MQKFTIILLAALFFTGGCDFIERVNPFAESTDTMELLQQRQDSIRRARQLQEQQEQARLELARAEALREAPEQENAEVKTSERYHLIVGAFKTPDYAREYHKKMLDNGHDSRIIMSNNNYHLVTIKSFDDYKVAVNEWREARDAGEQDIWIYTLN